MGGIFMKLRTLAFAFLLIGFSMNGIAQMKQADTAGYKSIIPVDKQSRLSNFSIIANQQYAFRNDFTDGEYMGSKFKMEQFRLEMRGWVTDKDLFSVQAPVHQLI